MTSHWADDAAQLPLDYLRGLACADSTVSVDEEYRILHIASPDKSKVALISGGGSGHEPSHAGMVGTNSLTAAVGGNIFASPNANQVRRALSLVENEKGTLVIVKRYTGDVLHFGMAGESAASNVEFLVVGDDVAVPRSQGELVGRRGLAGTTLVYKVAGHAAAQGKSLADVKKLAQTVADNVATIGASFAHCHVPGTKPDSSEKMAMGEFELGMGIHNEPGLKRYPQQKKKELIDHMVKLLTDTEDKERAFVPWAKGDEAVVMLNNLGGMSELELVGLVPFVLDAVQNAGIKAVRLFVGTFMTSLDMPGFSITLLRLADAKDAILAGVDADSSAPGWKRPTVPRSKPQVTPKSAGAEQRPASNLKAGAEFIPAIERACEAVIKAEPEITRYDTVAGDGDCGLTLKAGAEAILRDIKSGKVKPDDVVNSIRTVSDTIERDMGGTSGALYAIFFSAFAKALDSGDASGGQVSAKQWADAAAKARDTLLGYTKARPPSRTLVDPLVAFTDALSDGEGAKKAAGKAKDAAENTKKLAATSGRAAYVDQEQLKKENVPDPGAYGLALIFEGLAGN
ncbi:hypothetical protein A1Q1_00056 [Trichosporon asahii var. asahii CBS 2479]|uniref:Dihydroxyacetone kinase n=1 Tax=Trichosporon asahii var. asahii (strain ATCC 90039 / CBS 2479 / JCM 2466 / KCTC 7840 / NBRC 103889/ NCYC 2677 / UAMH 7654) TaxID=1186058 RepID=J8TS38_TRIAS|nr:hypothetical protein A1Q1_00056 [Trichosporon asahii var. asahii CBS 2479]EJT53049.1 hypothetical protein A1Q1_00056 [Trichosporon asahii var. asahii CBS 2479]